MVCLSSLFTIIIIKILLYQLRLLEYANNYFDLTRFPDGETKRALLRTQKKRLGIVDDPGKGSGDENRKKKKRKM